MTLAGKVGVVTGAGSGLGRALTLELARRGARVVVSDVNREGAEETAALVRQAGVEAHVQECDVRSAESVEALARFADENLGGADLVANNAGVAVSGRMGAIPLEDWRFVVDVNLWGVIHGCHAFVPRFRARKSGFVLNVASAAGLLAPPELGPYNVTKAAVVALSETLHAELRADGVNVTVLCPTFFRTNILNASRGSDPKQRKIVESMMDRSRLQAPEVAKAALDALERGKLYAVPMLDGRMLWRLKRTAPASFARLLAIAQRRLAPKERGPS